MRQRSSPSRRDRRRPARVALQANSAAQAGEVVGYPMIRLGQSDVAMLDQNRHFPLPQIETVLFEKAAINKTIIRSISYLRIERLFCLGRQSLKHRLMSINSKEPILGFLR